MIQPARHQFQLLGLAVALACEAAVQASREELPTVSAEEIWLAEGRCARFGHPLACGRLPVAVAGVACVACMAEVRRYHAEFVALPAAL